MNALPFPSPLLKAHGEGGPRKHSTAMGHTSFVLSVPASDSLLLPWRTFLLRRAIRVWTGSKWKPLTRRHKPRFLHNGYCEGAPNAEAGNRAETVDSLLSRTKRAIRPSNSPNGAGTPDGASIHFVFGPGGAIKRCEQAS